MKKSILFTLALTFYVFAVIAQTELVPFSQVKEIADRNARSLWGTVFASEPLPYYSKDDQLIGYRFTYSIGSPFPDKSRLKEQCDNAYAQGDRTSQWGNGKYGRMFVSACRDLYPILDHSDVLSPEYAVGKSLERKAQEVIGGEIILKRAYYLGFQNQWFCYTNGVDDIYVKAFPNVQAVNREEFHQLVDPLPFFVATGDYSAAWNSFTGGNLLSPLSDVYINYADQCKYYDWSYGCSPTAAAMVLSYWDYSSMNHYYTYSKLVDYYFQRWDNLEGETDFHVPNVQLELANAMNTDETGGTLRSNIASGIQQVCNESNGYGFICDKYDPISSLSCFNKIVEEINLSRPVHIGLDLNTGFGFDGHSECAVAYNQAALEVGAHNTWDPGIDWVSYTLLTYVVTVHPGGGSGFPIEITHPVGDTSYYNTGEDEVFYAGDVYEIRWDHENNPTSYVKLQYSKDGGLSWNLIINNTDNDGVYDWVVPTGFVSSACRIRTIVYDASGNYAGSDASGGNFTITSGGSIEVLEDDVYTNAETDPDYYQFTHNYSSWCAVGVRSSYQWKIQMFSNLTFAPPDIASSGANSTVNFVVMDGNHTAAVPRGIKVNKVEGVIAYVEFEGGDDVLTSGSTSSFTWNSTDIVKMWDVHLAPGTYQFSLDVTSPYADLSFALYGFNGAPYFGNKASNIAISNSGGSGDGESFVITITDTDTYGLCVWANDGWSNTSFNISIAEAGQWTGLVSNNWHNPDNWSPNVVPGPSDDVTIDVGYTYFPIISNNAAYCNNLNLKSGAKLRVAGQDLHVGGNLVVHGQLEENNNNSDIIVSGNIIWESGSSANISANASMHMSEGNWVFKNGANAVLANGTVYFTGINTTNIKSYEANCAFNNMVNQKVAGSLNFSESTDTLKINGYFTNYYVSSQFNIWAEDPLVLKGALNNNGHLYCHAGKFIFGGTTPTIKLNTGDYFNNLSIGTTGTVFLADSLIVKGNLAIEAGSLSTSNFPIVIEGNWINNVGPSGFNCGLGVVVFQGSTLSKVFTNETFYHLGVSKTGSGSVMQFSGIGIEGNLNIYQGNYTLNGKQLVLEGSVAVSATGILSLPAGSLLRLSNYSSLNINYGGKIDITGTFADPVEIRGKLLTDSYFFNINPNAIIAAEYCIFRHMATEGVNVHHEAFVDPLHSFRSCTFRDGVPGGSLLTINNAQYIVIDSARFIANTWGGASNVIKSMNQGMVTFTNYSGEFSGEYYDNDPFNLIVWETAVPVVPAYTTVSGDVVTGEIKCYNATNVITVSESPLTFNLHAGGSATFIAGSKIIFKPGTKVFAGGYLHAFITTTGDYCGSYMPSMVSLVDGTEELDDTPDGSSFKIYPNPSDGKFTLTHTGTKQERDPRVNIYTFTGKLLVSKELKGESKHAFNLSGMPAGIYLLRVSDGETIETQKLIISQ